MARLAVLVAAVCFGTTGTAQALGPDGVDPLAVGAARILAGALLLLLWARHAASARRAAAGRSDREPLGGPGSERPAGEAVGGPGSERPAGERGAPPPAEPGAHVRRSRGALLAAGAGVAAYQLTFFSAVDRTGVAVGTVVAIGSGPAFTGLLGRVAGGEPLRARWVVATALACAGVALLVGGGGGAEVAPGGVALALVAGASYASYTVAAKRLLTAGHRPEAVMARAFGLGAVLLLPVLVATGGGGLGSPGGLALVLFLGAVPTALAYVLFARGLERLGSGETATLTLAEPLTASLLGVLVLGEAPTPAAVAGGLLVLGGLLALAAPVRGRGDPPRRGPRSRGAGAGAVAEAAVEALR